MLDDKETLYSKEVDLWALGIIAFILLAGYHPFDPGNDGADDEVHCVGGGHGGNDPSIQMGGNNI